MNDFIGNIFYFGSPKDGFKVYPDLGAISNIFAGYYTNTETDWILIAKKSDNITRYIYVRYGLLTSVNGRTGSCLGISIDFINCYFTDLKVFRTKVIEKIWEALLNNKILLEIQETSGKVAFKSFDLFDVGQYLDDMSKNIREVIANEQYSNYIKPSYEIADAGNNPIYGLHPDSSPSAINEYFRTHGIIKLSPKLPIETKSITEKEEDNKKYLEGEVEKLHRQLKQKDIEITNQLKQKDSEIESLKTKLQKLQGLNNSFSSEIANVFSESSSTIFKGQIINSQITGPKYDPYLDPQRIFNPPLEENESKRRRILDFFQSPIIFGILILLTILLFGAALYLIISPLVLFPRMESGKQANIEDKYTNQSKNQQNSSAKTNPPLTFNENVLLIKLEKGKTKAFLNESLFLDKNKGVRISVIEDFKELLTSYLFKYSPEVSEIYLGDKEMLWNEIISSNQGNKTKITEYLEK